MATLTAEPLIVMLHGAGTGAWVWDSVRERVGAESIALDVPGRREGVSPDSCAQAIIRQIPMSEDRPIVFVLHSLAGVLAVPLVAQLGNVVQRLVFVSAIIPPDGKRYLDALPLANRAILRGLFRVRRNGLVPSAAMIRQSLCNDLTPEDTATVIARYQPEWPGLYLKPVSSGRLPTGAVYIKLMRDRAVSRKLQDESIARLGDPVVHPVHAGHLAMLSAPAELAGIIEEAAEPA